MRPPTEVIELVDHLVAKLDREAMADQYRPRATSSFGVILDAWNHFKARVDQLDLAVSNPFAESAASVLMTADVLVGVEVARLAFWLGHVGDAIARGTVR